MCWFQLCMRFCTEFPLTLYRPAMPFGNRKKDFWDLSCSVLSQLKKYPPSWNLKFSNLRILKGLKLRILVKKIVPVSLKLNFTPNTLGCKELTARSDFLCRDSLSMKIAANLRKEKRGRQSVRLLATGRRTDAQWPRSFPKYVAAAAATATAFLSTSLLLSPAKTAAAPQAGFMALRSRLTRGGSTENYRHNTYQTEIYPNGRRAERQSSGAPYLNSWTYPKSCKLTRKK